MHTLLRVAAGRVPLSEGLALLALPAVAARVESLGTDPATLVDRVCAAGITWGLNADHRQSMDAGDQGTGTWREGLDLDQALDQVLAAGDDRFDSLAAVNLVGQLRAAETDHACDVALDAAAVADWLDQVVQEEVRTVSRVGGGMAMGGFKPMRAMPCRVLAVMGLHDAAFPRRARAPAWDLLAAAPQSGDRDPVRHLEVARACQQRQEEATPFHANVFESPEAVPSDDLELREIIRILKDPWVAWLGGGLRQTDVRGGQGRAGRAQTGLGTDEPVRPGQS